jgi:hypothetical protein
VTDHAYAPAPAGVTMEQPSEYTPASVTLKRPSLRFSSAVGSAAQSSTCSTRGVVCRFCGRRGRFLNPFRERK